MKVERRFNVQTHQQHVSDNNAMQPSIPEGFFKELILIAAFALEQRHLLRQDSGPSNRVKAMCRPHLSNFFHLRQNPM